jgi:hypothetical protein
MRFLPNLASECTRRYALIPRGERHNLWGKEPHRQPCELSHELARPSGMLRDIEVHRGPDTKTESKEAARHESVGPPAIRLIFPPRGSVGEFVRTNVQK